MTKIKNRTPEIPTFLLLLLILLVLSAADVDDVKCLKEIKNLVQDPKQKLSSWSFTNSSAAGFICKFTGVTCWDDKENRVLALQLRNFQLSGNILGSLQFCSNIQTLDLSGNDFSGPIPAGICSVLPFLISLNLSSNDLSGHIPTNLSNCTFLHTLVLSNNSISGTIPPVLSSLARLTVFSVADNDLTGPIPQSFAHFDESDFDGNDGLCGSPVESKCGGLTRKNLAIIVAAGVAGATASMMLTRKNLITHNIDYTHDYGCSRKISTDFKSVSRKAISYVNYRLHFRQIRPF